MKLIINALGERFTILSLRKKEQSARVALFVYAIRVLTFFQSLRFMKAPLRVERESLSLRKENVKLLLGVSFFGVERITI